MRRFNSPLLILLVLVGLLGVTVYAIAQCGGGKTSGCGMKSATGCATTAGCGAKAAACTDAAKLQSRGRAVTTTRTLGNAVVATTQGRRATFITVTTRGGQPNTDATVTATLDGKTLPLKKLAPGRYVAPGAGSGKLALSVRTLGATETTSLNLAPVAGGCPMASKCADKAKACACGADCKCKPGAPAADCKCAGECKCGVKASCGTAGKCADKAKACACGADCKCKPGAPAAGCKCVGECKCGVKAGCGTACKPVAAAPASCGGCARK